MNKIDKYMIIIGSFIALFVITMIVIYCIYQSEPEHLITGVLGTGGVECLICAVIKVVGSIIDKKSALKDLDTTEEIINDEIVG